MKLKNAKTCRGCRAQRGEPEYKCVFGYKTKPPLVMLFGYAIPLEPCEKTTNATQCWKMHHQRFKRDKAPNLTGRKSKMRKNFEMTQEDLNELLEACKPVPMIAIHCGPISSPQENANRAWQALGSKMGFDGMTVCPTGQGDRFFSAEVSASPQPDREEG